MGTNPVLARASLLPLDRDHVVLEDLEEFLDSEKDAKSAMVGWGGVGRRHGAVTTALWVLDSCWFCAVSTAFAC